MKLIKIYQCLCDETRLRILYLLTKSPLCVCHLQSILNLPQVKISKHLAYLKERGMVKDQRRANWKVYALPEDVPSELDANLKCLHDCVMEKSIFREDLARYEAIKDEIKSIVSKGAV